MLLGLTWLEFWGGDLILDYYIVNIKVNSSGNIFVMIFKYQISNKFYITQNHKYKFRSFHMGEPRKLKYRAFSNKRSKL